MNAKQAELLAKAVGGDAWQSGGGVWLVSVQRGDGRLVVFSGDAVCEYEDDDAFEAGRAANTILLSADDEDGGDREYIICDRHGNVFYRDDGLELGWRDENEARREARGLESRGEGRFFVRERE